MAARGWGVVLWGMGLVACGSDGAGDQSTPTGGSGGQLGQSGSPAGQGGNKLSGGSGGSGGSAGSAAGGAPSTITLAPQPMCEGFAAACEGECLAFGESKHGCTHVAEVSSPTSITALGGDLYFSGSFFQPLQVERPPLGLHRFAGGTLERTELDTMNYAHQAVAMDLADGVLYYLVDALGMNEVRSVPVTGGTPTVLATGLADGNSLVVRGDRVYVASALPGDGEFERVRWLPKLGGVPTNTDLTSVSRLRANTTHLVGSWNGDIEHAPLPDGIPATDLLGDFALPGSDGWYIDDQYVYWLTKEGEYKRLALNTLVATEERGEVLQTLPAGMTIIANSSEDLLLAVHGESATGLFTMPLTGGTPTRVAVIGETRLMQLATLDPTYIYIVVGGALLRIER